MAKNVQEFAALKGMVTKYFGSPSKRRTSDAAIKAAEAGLEQLFGGSPVVAAQPTLVVAAAKSQPATTVSPPRPVFAVPPPGAFVPQRMLARMNSTSAR